MPMHWGEKFLPISVFFLFLKLIFPSVESYKKHFVHSSFQKVKNIAVEILWRLDLETEIMS